MSILRIEDLKKRSERSASDFCWHWKGAKCADGVPRIWTVDHDICEKRSMSGPKAVWNIAHSEGTKGRLAYRVCVCVDCVNPAHIKLAASKAEIGQHIKRSGTRKGTCLDQRRANVIKAQEARGIFALPPEKVRQIRLETGTLDQIAARHGIACETAGRIRRGDSHKRVI